MRRVLFPAFLFLVLLLLLLDPSRYFDSVQGGVLLFASSVLPSMLPYFFFTKLLTGTGCVGALTSTIGRPIGRLYRLSPTVAYPFLMSLLSGYPVGARVLADLYDKGLIGGEEAARASSFCSTSGSMFVLGSVGAVILKDGAAGAVILASHYLGAVLNGLLYRGKTKGGGCVPAFLPSPKAEALLSDAMYESVLSLAAVGGFIAMANLLGDMFFDLLSKAGVSLSGSVAGGVLYSVFEVTRGCVEFSALGVQRALKTALCCFAVSFGGLSVLLQSLAFLGKTGITPLRFLLIKTTQAIISFAVCAVLGCLFL